MGNYLLDDLVMDKARIELRKTPEGLNLLFSGTIDSQNSDILLSPFFDGVHKKIIEKGIKHVDLDFTKLEFLNSRGIKNIVRWILFIPQVPEENSYRIKMIACKHREWQATSLKMLTIIAPAFVTIQVR